MTELAKTATHDVVIRILTACAEAFGVRIFDLLSPMRSRTISQARGVAAYLLRKQQFSYPEIGFHLGGKDHSSMLVAVRKVEAIVGAGADLQMLARLSDAERRMDASSVRYRVVVPTHEEAPPVRARVA